MSTVSRRIKLEMVPLGDARAFGDRIALATIDEPELTLRQLLAERPALATTPVPAELLDVQVARINLQVVAAGDTPLHWPPGMTTGNGAAPAATPVAADSPVTAPTGGGELPESGHPHELDEPTAVRLAHDQEIVQAAAYLETGLSVLIRCEKLLVEHLAGEIAKRSGRTPAIVEVVAGSPVSSGMGGMTGGRRQELLAALQAAVRTAKPSDVVVVPHLDLLAGGSDAALSAEARELTDVLYARSECVLLAFVDPSLVIPEVLANRFAVRLGFDILPRELRTRDGDRVPSGQALVTDQEAALFTGFDAAGLYKHIAGMNAVRLRHAMRFAFHQHQHAPSTFEELLAELRTFKVATSSSFELPNVSFDQIGGYADVRKELQRALRLIRRSEALPPSLRHELAPRGFIFHGPPGTGKTLFAKAMATAMEATIQVVSGPEITDMYVGESERKVRELFAEARRNAPAVLVFDEFDSIASKRTGREDGGSRAGNAIVAQLLTELDGFRSEVAVLVIGTTNRLDIIDKALLRPSRFRAVHIDLPDVEARQEIARVHAEHFGVPAEPELLAAIAAATDRMNGDEIRSLFRDARADELVGEPARPADARRLGELVGALRKATQESEVSVSAQQGIRTAAGHRRRLAVTVGAAPLPTTTNSEESPRP